MGKKLAIEEMNRLSPEAFTEAEKIPLILLLDQVRSMNNVGSILRSADAFRIQQVLLGGITPKPPHREITKTAIGAENSVDWQDCPDPVQSVRELKAAGYRVLALEQARESQVLATFPVDVDAKYLLVIGHEITGVSQEIIDLADATLEIPQYGTKHSLNVSVAAGIALHHLAMGFWQKHPS